MRTFSAPLLVLLVVSPQLGCGDDGSTRKSDGGDGRPAGTGGGGGGALGSGGVPEGSGGGPAGSGGGSGGVTAGIEPAVDGATVVAEVGSAGAGGAILGTGGSGGSIPDASGDAIVVDVAVSARLDVAADSFDTGVDVPLGADGDVAGVDVASDAIDYIIIAADGLAASARRYRDFRRASGFNVDLGMIGDIVGNAPDLASATSRMQDHVRSRYQRRDPGRPIYLLLLGDAQATWPGDRSGVPAGTWQPASGEPVVSDNVFADLDGDDIPDLAVGRITADSDAEVDLVRAKVAAYEGNYAPGGWNRRLGIFASTSGMGDLVDVIIETIVYDITEAIPYDFDVSMTYARQSSPYVYIPEEFSDQVYRRINEGALLTAYVGHGSRDGFAKLDWNGKSYPILDTEHLEKLTISPRSPILMFVACTTGDFVGGESVSERILVQKDAPAAIFSSTEISDPYANAIFIYEVSQAFTHRRAVRVGDAFREAKQYLLSNDDGVRQKIDTLAALLVSSSARDGLKHSHLHMYTLFGDPAMAVAYAGHAQVVAGTDEEPVASVVKAGAVLTVTTTVPALGASAEAVVTLESPRKVILGAIAPVPVDGDPSRDAVIAKNYSVANDKVAVLAKPAATGTSFTTQLTVPANLTPGQYHLKVFVRDGSRDFAGALPMAVN